MSQASRWLLPHHKLLRTDLASVQDACILAMLRLAAMCDVSDEVYDIIARVYDKGGRHVKKVVQLFLFPA